MGQVLHDLQQFDASEKVFQEALAAVTDEDSNAYRTISGTVIYCDFAAGLSWSYMQQNNSALQLYLLLNFLWYYFFFIGNLENIRAKRLPGRS